MAGCNQERDRQKVRQEGDRQNEQLGDPVHAEPVKDAMYATGRELTAAPTCPPHLGRGRLGDAQLAGQGASRSAVAVSPRPGQL